MLRPVFRIEQESKETLRATLKGLMLKHPDAWTDDAKLIAAIRNELNDRALRIRTKEGWPKALDDEPDNLPFD